MSDDKVIGTWEELLEVDDAEYTEVPVGSGKSVRLGSISSNEMIKWIEDNGDDEKVKTNGLVLVAKCLVDAEGKRIGKVADMLQLRDKQPKTVKKLVDAAVALNNLVVRSAEKNDSSEAQPSASPIDTASA